MFIARSLSADLRNAMVMTGTQLIGGQSQEVNWVFAL
jgi:hypothetical protein